MTESELTDNNIKISNSEDPYNDNIDNDDNNKTPQIDNRDEGIYARSALMNNKSHSKTEEDFYWLTQKTPHIRHFR